jgi:tricorn protease interacting factor F2/3
MLKDGKLTLRQERFLLSGTPDREVWPIPVAMELNDEPKNFLLEKKEETFDVTDIKSLKVNVDRAGFYRVHYGGLYDMLWRSKPSAIDRWGIVSDAFSFLLSGKMLFSDYLVLIKNFDEEGDYLPAHEVSDQLSLLHAIVPTKVSEVSSAFHRTQLKILRERPDENSSMLRGIMASRLALVDGAYATELASKFKDYEQVEPDMKLAVAVAYSTSTGDYDEVLRRYRESRSDEDKVRLLNAMTAFRDETLLIRSLGFALSSEVKKQDVRTVVLAATEKPDAKKVAWTWLRVNIGKIRALYQGTGLLSGIFLSTIPILGIARIQEVEKFFSENKMPEAEKGVMAGLEKLEVYDRLVKSIDQKVRNSIL